MSYSNEVIKCLYERGSVRAFSEKEVSNETLKEIVDAGCHAATGGNLQPYSIISIRSDEKKQELMDTGCMQAIVKQAPVSLLFVIDWHRSKQWAEANNAPFSALDGYRHFWIAFQDTIIAAQNICTAADSLGLGSVYLGTVESCFDELKPMFNLPDGTFPVVILSLGYPKVKPIIAPKLLSDVIMHEEVYNYSNDSTINEIMNSKYDDRSPTPLSKKNMDTLYSVSKEVHGESFAKKAVEHANELGNIHLAQRYFGLHYSANWSRTGNGDFLNSLRNYGFTFVDGINHPITSET